MLSDIHPDLERFGDRVATELHPLALQCEEQPPQLRQYNAYGHRVDEILTCNAWKHMKTVSAEEGLIAAAYERNYGPWR